MSLPILAPLRIPRRNSQSAKRNEREQVELGLEIKPSKPNTPSSINSLDERLMDAKHHATRHSEESMGLDAYAGIADDNEYKKTPVPIVTIKKTPLIHAITPRELMSPFELNEEVHHTRKVKKSKKKKLSRSQKRRLSKKKKAGHK